MYHFMSTRYACILVLTTILLIPLALAENEVENNKELEVGMVAPNFTLKDETGTERNLNEFLGKKNVVLAFYPKDFTGGWTAELQSLRDKLSEIEKTDTVLFGVSVDTVESHKKFKDDENFGFSLLADTEFDVSKQYSGIMERFNASNRVTFIIDKAGYIRAIDKDVKVRTHGEDVVKMLGNVLPKIEVGEIAPDFIAIDSEEKKYQLSKFKDKKHVALVFYPRDFGQSWTVQVCSLRDESSNLDQQNIQVFGITPNDAESHQKFTEENKLNFPLLLDTGRNLALLFGATDKLEGRFNRITIVIDKSGKIIQIDKDVKPATQGPDLVNFIKSQKTN